MLTQALGVLSSQRPAAAGRQWPPPLNTAGSLFLGRHWRVIWLTEIGKYLGLRSCNNVGSFSEPGRPRCRSSCA